ncbi:bifunctional 4-hydroxy-2-oxoglutarate aldolase/2-dehydro-3-deoxy-phosphogluconate aldolase (plasmid) [Streptomyces sp. NBC_00841]|uniref:bifunctional 4-hydroxy-2-oxoglutarate aldolase/2-dehydro-3-deoxy-phosphogluconate aldolase n=1 Tax=unclassified Streptomyces TaxID=2593676 RepID=UPI002256D9EC|nr:MULTISPECIES: bifunctional 4-hydroxy-2-oxoglutarate aldolase/2-dehydro-3-deoxy-phosphogluconate aldolase [unclassified Streptomyces]MCX4538832.1 bifunctional 4-hydroxy-2-oxoglutarate aldolase/2-dehydro-3-deoxy-phosphogluconate aldolase [Streptomyces sp. NBC_01669]WSA05373.1 bifunctional 4-hydroxy-2-oxoglutarate aldolase/2-dehydro-3-deoxy-phosphogluconate aldolase [Streptomyces sp. NBC_00841]
MRLTELPFRTMAIVRGSNPSAALRCVLTLCEEGITGIEVSLTTSGALSVLEQARRELGADALLGAGTVLSAEDAARAADAGAGFLVTPGFVPDLRCGPDELPVLMGALTPSEIMAADRSGALAVKLFPASVGGPEYLAALRAPFPDVPFVPVGGIDATVAAAHLAAGAVAVGVGSPLVGDAADGGDLTALRARAARWREALTEAAA